MIKILPFRNFIGFGNGDYINGEYYFSENMSRTQNGISPAWSIMSSIDSSQLAIGNITQFTEIKLSNQMNVYAYDDNTRRLFKSLYGTETFSFDYRIRTINAQKTQIIGDRKNRLLYATDRYLGKYEGAANYVTGTVQVTNGSTSVVGTGTSWDGTMVNKAFYITGDDTSTGYYFVQSVTDATHLTLNVNYTGTSGSGKAYTVYSAWSDTWKDFGSEVGTKDVEIFEDVVLFARANNLCRLNNDDSVNGDSAPAFSFPTGFDIVSLKSGKNGILIGANFNNRGVLALWDNYAGRSIAPWIWFDSTIQIILAYGDNWIVITSKEIIITNGYTTQTLSIGVDSTLNSASFSVNNKGAIIIKGKLLILNLLGQVNRARAGLCIFDLNNHKWEFSSLLGRQFYSVSLGAVYSDSSLNAHISFGGIDNKTYIGKINYNAPNQAYYISQPLGEGDNLKVSEAIKLNMGLRTDQTLSRPIDFSVDVKITNTKRVIWGYSQAKVDSDALNKIYINGTLTNFAKAEVGDEITILSGGNSGQIRHITQINNQGTSSESWILDSDLPTLALQNDFISVSPFKLIGTYDFVNETDLDQLSELYFPDKIKILGQKFYIKIVFRGLTSSVIPELFAGQFIYDDLGVLP